MSETNIVRFPQVTACHGVDEESKKIKQLLNNEDG